LTYLLNRAKPEKKRRNKSVKKINGKMIVGEGKMVEIVERYAEN